MVSVKYDKYSLIINGKRELIRSGAFHYFRTPGAELAKDRFSKLKSAGYNTVDIYLNANYHCPKEGVYDFEGIKDIKEVLKAASDLGLFVIIRPGPFINAEVNAGGLPYWILAKKDVVPRCRIGTTYQYSPEFVDFIRQWYDQVIPVINEFDNIIAFQIENEYATDEMDEEYMQELYNMARERGITCPIFHNDAYCAGLWADMLDIYACDIYPYINPNQNWKQDHFCFDTLDNIEDNVRCFKEDSPIFIAEMQGGWFDKWDGIGYEAMREALGDQHINIMTKTAISQGVSMFNHYMAIGGTSWGNLACDEVYTSYEFCAPIDEYGCLKPNFYKAKAINYFLKSFSLAHTDERENLDLGENIYAVRRHDYENDSSWVFIRNLNQTKIALDSAIKGLFGVSLNPYDMKICAENLNLNACRIEFSDAEIFARVKNDKDEVIFIISDKDAKIHIDINGKKLLIPADKKDYENIKWEKDGKTTEFLFISKELADRTWVLDDKVIFNADFVYPNGRIAISKTTEVAYYDLINGFSKKYFKYMQESDEITLKDFDISFCAPEIDTDYDYSNWKQVKEELDALSCEAYDEFIWYKAKIGKDVKEITLSARHLFALYINGKELLNRNSYKYEKLKQIEETISVELDSNILNRDENELTILVQNLGFDKGFSGDTNNPRGLVDFNIIPEQKIDFYVQEKLSPERGEFEESENPYFARLSTKFDIEFKENVIFSKYLSLKDFPYDRATIFLNGVKIGRYLKNTNHIALQDKFYLINTFLNPENTLDIIIWQKDSNIKTPWDFKNELKHVIMSVGDETKHQLY